MAGFSLYTKSHQNGIENNFTALRPPLDISESTPARATSDKSGMFNIYKAFNVDTRNHDIIFNTAYRFMHIPGTSENQTFTSPNFACLQILHLYSNQVSNTDLLPRIDSVLCNEQSLIIFPFQLPRLSQMQIRTRKELQLLPDLHANL